jgi:hypothetical protein
MKNLSDFITDMNPQKSQCTKYHPNQRAVRFFYQKAEEEELSKRRAK